MQVSPLGDLNNDGNIDATRVKTELYPKGMGIKEWDINDAKDRPHSYRECSNAGKCNRLTGVCKCREGFEGSACQRRKCRPNDYVKDCNGNGICVSSDDYIRIATQGSAGNNGWELKKYNRCLCDNGWKGRYCEKRVCNKGYDPKYYETLFQFGYTLQDAEGGTTAAGDGSTISHYLAFTYNGMTYKTPIIDSYKDICSGDKSNPAVLNVDLGILFKEELKKKLKYLPYFTPVDISLSCSGENKEKVDSSTNKIEKPNTQSNGKFLTVVLTLDYIDVTPILSMKLNVYKADDTTSALVYGIKEAVYDSNLIRNDTYGTFQDSISQAVWLVKYHSLITDDDTSCYSNHRFENDKVKYPSYPLDIKKECSTSKGQFDIYTASSLPPGFPVKGQLECSGRGICNEETGLCKCATNYYGSACNRIANY